MNSTGLHFRVWPLAVSTRSPFKETFGRDKTKAKSLVTTPDKLRVILRFNMCLSEFMAWHCLQLS